ncbi:hypothetical protein B0F90DRAFT_1935913, partial [Multifurca ochricompacta]
TAPTLTRPQFDKACKAFINKPACSTSSPNASRLRGWLWREHPTVPRLGYLTRTIPLQGEIVNDLAVARDIPPEPGFLSCSQSITFSSTFQVPVFYFTVHDT